MRFDFAIPSLIGVLAVTAGCQHSSANRCPHCQQIHAAVEANPPAAPRSAVAPVTHWESPSDPIPQFSGSHPVTTGGFTPIPAVPGATE